ncbi:MAG: hypothetical protein IKD80_00070, partial [Selenomonadaceae bacterium]|nr:hypothetical protein [Selenomonadaceae bacterium]
QIYTTPVYKAILEKGSASLAEDNTFTLEFVRGEVGGDSLAFKGFVNLYLPTSGDDDDDESAGEAAYFVDESGNQQLLGIGGASFDSDGNITGYTFKLTNLSAINWDAFRGGSATELSITDIGGGASSIVPVNLIIDTDDHDDGSGSASEDVIPDILQPTTIAAHWTIDSGLGAGYYNYYSMSKTEYFMPVGGASAYDPKTSNVSSFIYQKSADPFEFQVWGELNHSALSGTETTVDAKYFSISEIYDITGALSSVVLTLNRMAFVNGTDSRASLDSSLLYNGAQVYLVGAKGTSATLVTTQVKLGKDFHEDELRTNKDATFTAVGGSGFSGVYNFAGSGITAGLYEDTINYRGTSYQGVIFAGTSSGFDPFTITGLAEGLSIATLGGGNYSVYLGSGSSSLGVGTIASNGVFTINSLSALFTKGLSAGDTLQIALTDTRDGDNTNYTLAFTPDTMTEKTKSLAKLDDGNDTADGMYTYTASVKAAYVEDGTPRDNKFIYHAETKSDTFDITGLSKGLSGIYIDGTTIYKNASLSDDGTLITGTDTESIGTLTYDNNWKRYTFTFNSLILPGADSSAVIGFSAADTTAYSNYRFALASDSSTEEISRQTIFESFLTVGSASSYAYTSYGSTSGWYVAASGQSILYADKVGGEQFTIAGVAAGLAGFASDQTVGGDVFKGSASALNISDSGVITVYKGALVAGQSITLTDGTGDMLI